MNKLSDFFVITLLLIIFPASIHIFIIYTYFSAFPPPFGLLRIPRSTKIAHILCMIVITASLSILNPRVEAIVRIYPAMPTKVIGFFKRFIIFFITHNHHFKWWFDLALIRAGYMHAQKGGYRKRCYWSAYKAVLLESSFLDSSACSLIYFFIASSVILPIVET